MTQIRVFLKGTQRHKKLVLHLEISLLNHLVQGSPQAGPVMARLQDSCWVIAHYNSFIFAVSFWNSFHESIHRAWAHPLHLQLWVG